MFTHAIKFFARKLGAFLLEEGTAPEQYHLPTPKKKTFLKKSSKFTGARTYEQLCAIMNPNVLHLEILLPGNKDYIDDISDKYRSSLLDQMVVPLHHSQVKELIPANDDVATKKKGKRKRKADRLHFKHPRPVMIRFSKHDTLLVQDNDGRHKEYSMGPGSGRPLEIIPEDHVDLHIDKDTYGYIKIGEGAF